MNAVMASRRVTVCRPLRLGFGTLPGLRLLNPFHQIAVSFEEVVDHLRDIGPLAPGNLLHEGKRVGLQIDRNLKLRIG